MTAAESVARLTPYFEAQGERADLIEQIFTNADVDRRYLARPQDFYLEHTDLTTRNAAYGEAAQELGTRAARAALEQAKVEPGQVDMVIDTSCTGLMIPALDAYLCNALELRRDVRRMPLTEVGCAAGAVAISRACEFLKGEPDATVLIVAVELPSLTLQLEDGSRANLVSAAIFGDGAAAVVLRNAKPAGLSLEHLAHKSVLFPNTLELMGFQLKTEGLQIVLSRRIPALVKQAFRPEVEAFLKEQDLSLSDIGFYILHPGGTRVLDNLRSVLELTEAQVQASRKMLRQYGNLSSASVLFVARELLDQGGVRAGELGLLCAMGPGFAVEMVLLRGRE